MVVIHSLFTNNEIFLKSFKYQRTNTLGEKVTWDKDGNNFCQWKSRWVTSNLTLQGRNSWNFPSCWGETSSNRPISGNTQIESTMCIWRQDARLAENRIVWIWYKGQVDLWIPSPACADRQLILPSQQQWDSGIRAIRHCREQKSITSQKRKIKRILIISMLSPLSNQNTSSQVYNIQTKKLKKFYLQKQIFPRAITYIDTLQFLWILKSMREHYLHIYSEYPYSFSVPGS